MKPSELKLNDAGAKASIGGGPLGTHTNKKLSDCSPQELTAVYNYKAKRSSQKAKNGALDEEYYPYRKFFIGDASDLVDEPVKPADNKAVNPKQ